MIHSTSAKWYGGALLLLMLGGCMPLPKRAKAQLIVPHDCIVRIDIEPDTECRQNVDGTGRMLCYNLKLIKKKGCEYVTPSPQAQVPDAQGRVQEPR